MCGQVFPPDRNFREDFDRQVETPDATQVLASWQALFFIQYLVKSIFYFESPPQLKNLPALSFISCVIHLLPPAFMHATGKIYPACSSLIPS
jgi:hypothetical protein